MSSTNAQQPWFGWPFAACQQVADPNATLPQAPAPSEAERYDIVRVVYLDAACRGEERTLLYDHADALPRGAEPTRCERDLRPAGPIRFGEACAIAEKLVKPYPKQEG